MAQLKWHEIGDRQYETGVDKGVLYPQDTQGAYPAGYAWNGLSAVTESPSGAEPTAIYADNVKYLNLISAEEFAATIEAYSSPKEFDECDGTKELVPGVTVGQQARKPFGFSYRTILGNEVQLNDFGYKIHLIWNATAAPSEKAYATVNDSPEAITFSWEVSTTPTEVGEGFRPTANMTIDSTTIEADKLKVLEDILYGTAEEEPRLPSPVEVLTLLTGEDEGEEGTQG